MESCKFDPHVNWLPPCYASTTQFHALDPVELEEEDQQQRELCIDSVNADGMLPSEGSEKSFGKVCRRMIL